MILELPDTINVYVKANNTTYPVDMNKVPVERVIRALGFGWQTMFGNARNGAGQGNGSNVAMITPFIQKKVDQQYTAIEAGTTGQRTVDPVERETKRLAKIYADKWMVKNAKTKKENAAEYDARVEKYAANDLVRAEAAENVAKQAALQAALDD